MCRCHALQMPPPTLHFPTQRRPMKMNPALWKTVLCENHLKTGVCKYDLLKILFYA